MLKKSINKKNIWKKMKCNWQIYLLLLPGTIYFAIFFFGPIWGLSIAFFDFNAYSGGLANSEFVGIQNFIDFFSQNEFFEMLRNTVVISGMSLVFYFPAPILLAVILNEIKNERFKRLNQSIVYLPHFLSWVVIAGLTFFLLSTDVGIVNRIIAMTGADKVSFLSDEKLFWWILLFQTTWKEIGWGSILFLASISQINPELYEAATVDGANRYQKILKITIPGITPTIIVLFLIQMGKIMNVNFEQVLIMYNPAVRPVAEIFDTYAYKIGAQLGNYSIGATVGIFKSVVGLIMVVLSNGIIKRTGHDGIY